MKSAPRTFNRLVIPLVLAAAVTVTACGGKGGTSGARPTTTARLEILQPTVRVLPSVGPPGHVVLVYGESMPPGSEVSLTWAPGINIHSGPFEVSEQGTVRAPMLIVRRDLIGNRLITATSATELFTPVAGGMLVVPRTLGPPDFDGRG